MNISMYQISVPLFVQSLEGLRGILEKAEAHCTARRIDPGVLLSARLYPDMWHLARQIHVTCDFARNVTVRLTGSEPEKWKDDEATFAEFRDRIDRTIAVLRSFPSDQIDGCEDRTLMFPVSGVPTPSTGKGYLVNYALASFFFHHAMAYAILRHNGVDLNKFDYLGDFRR